MTKKEIKTLKKNLPKGWVKTLAAKYNHSEVYIYKVVNGERPNPTVLNEAIKMAVENKQKQEKQAQASKELLKTIA